MKTVSLACGKLRAPSSGSCELREGEERSSNRTVDFDEEYNEAFRTKSYEDILRKVQEQINGDCSDRPGQERSSSSSRSTSSLPFYVHLADYLSEPQRPAVDELIERLKCHRLIGDYFEASLEACDLCDLLLQDIYQMRSDHHKFRYVIRLSKMLQESGDASHKLWETVYRELAVCALQRNPVSFGERQLRDFHISNFSLLDRLTRESRRVTRRVKMNRICKKIGGSCFVISYTALVTNMIHGLEGVGVLGSSETESSSREDWDEVGSSLPTRTRILEKIGMQLDLATKGTYILINDFDTIRMFVRRLEGEVDHWRALANLCVRNKKDDLLREVVKEFDDRDLCYQEQLKELERHVYLCFNTIDKSRRQVMQEIKSAISE